MILDIDAGNTRLKWRVSDKDSTICCGAEHGPLQQMLNKLILHIHDTPVERVRIVHVLGFDRENELRIFFKKKLNKLVEVARAIDSCSGVINEYNPAEALGVDRWLAVLAAFRRANKKCCIIDCGSAVTVDFVLSSGAYVGGYIVPGVKNMGATLSYHTQQLPLVDIPKEVSLLPGKSTNQAIANGVFLMTAAFLEASVKHFFANTNENPIVFLTGGDADFFVSTLNVGLGAHVECVPDLVLDGLSIALP